MVADMKKSVDQLAEDMFKVESEHTLEDVKRGYETSCLASDMEQWEDVIDVTDDDIWGVNEGSDRSDDKSSRRRSRRR